MRHKLKAKIPADLIDKIYKQHGWRRKAGESRTKRVTEMYEITLDGDYMVATLKDEYVLTPRQKDILTRDFAEGHNFVILSCQAEDRVAKSLSNKGLGYFTSFKHHYSWRPRSGYLNHFTPNENGMEMREKLK